MLARLIEEIREVKETMTNWLIADDPDDDYDIYSIPGVYEREEGDIFDDEL
jgi:hypothetical protein